MDPITALAIASTAFNAIKKGISIGNDVESMSSDIGRWMGAIGTIREAEQKAKNPSIFKSFLAKGSVEQEAIEAFAANKKAEAMENELKTFINFHYGPDSWNEILRMQGRIRKQRRDEIKRQEEFKERVLVVFASILLILAIFALGSFIYLHI